MPPIWQPPEPQVTAIQEMTLVAAVLRMVYPHWNINVQHSILHGWHPPTLMAIGTTCHRPCTNRRGLSWDYLITGCYHSSPEWHPEHFHGPQKKGRQFYPLCTSMWSVWCLSQNQNFSFSGSIHPISHIICCGILGVLLNQKPEHCIN